MRDVSETLARHVRRSGKRAGARLPRSARCCALLGGAWLVLFGALACQSGTPPTSERGLGGAGNLGGAGSDPADPKAGASGGKGGKSSGGDGSGGAPEPCEDTESCGCTSGQYVSDGECIDSICAPGNGVFVETSECFSCSPAASCDGSGETGRILAIAPIDEGTCVCETKPGYFPGSEGSIAEKCDADGDGWVSDRAQPSVESENVVVRENARCDVRRVRSFFLECEHGKIYDLAAEEPEEDLAVLFPGAEGVPAGLPLYESSRNDADPDGDLPHYGEPPEGRRLLPAEVNSLTKACVGTTTDANDNGVNDVREWPGADSSRDFANATIEQYYEKYAEFSYFLALHEGRWEPDAALGIYRVVERRRSPAGAGSALLSVPIEYPEGTVDHAMACERHPDTLFLGASGELSSGNRTGGDFIGFAGAEMLHHSQFKCVQTTTEAGYGAASAEARPELVYVADGKVTRREGAALVGHEWTFNDCFVDSTTAMGPNNPALPEISCQARTRATEKESVYWAAVHYSHYEDPYSSPADPGGYVRGCANECADKGAAPNECWGCTEESFGGAATLDYGTACGDGTASCDGDGVCSGCVPGHTQCKGATVQQVCGDDRTWGDNVSCQFGCDASVGKCFPACAPGAIGCSDGGLPRVCDENGAWKNLAACVGQTECTSGKCLMLNGRACTSGSQCQSGVCSAFFDDQDSDGYGAGQVYYCGTSPPAKAASISGDCCDQDANAKPGQTSYFPDPNECGDFDYNCDKAEEREYPRVNACSCPNAGAGWRATTTVPDCGDQARFGGCVDFGGGCGPDPTAGLKTQECR